jgi:hypothetical protein
MGPTLSTRLKVLKSAELALVWLPSHELPISHSPEALQIVLIDLSQFHFFSGMLSWKPLLKATCSARHCKSLFYIDVRAASPGPRLQPNLIWRYTHSEGDVNMATHRWRPLWSALLTSPFECTCFNVVHEIEDLNRTYLNGPTSSARTVRCANGNTNVTSLKACVVCWSKRTNCETDSNM